MESHLKNITAILVTSEPIAAYGGVQFNEEFVYEIEKALLEGDIPFVIRHDPRLQLDVKVISTETRRSENGYLQLLVTWQMADSDWAGVQREGLRGMSVSVTSTVRQTSSVPPTVSIAADAHWFTDAELNRAFDEISRDIDAAEIRHLYQFAFDPTALVVLTFVGSQLTALAIGLLTNALYDALKHFLHRNETPSIFHLTFEDEKSGRKMSAYVETNSDRTLRHAIDTLPEALRTSTTVEYSEEDNEWK
jgi:hypothetical protein